MLILQNHDLTLLLATFFSANRGRQAINAGSVPGERLTKQKGSVRALQFVGVCLSQQSSARHRGRPMQKRKEKGRHLAPTAFETGEK